MAMNSFELSLVATAQHTQATAHTIPNVSQSTEEKVSRENLPATSPTALVSWAHRGEGWSDEDASEWTTQVVEFTAALRANGIDADLDLFHAHEPDIDWTRFGPRAVDSSDFVIIAISEAWAQRWSGTNNPTVGAGAVAESDALKGLFQKDQSAWQRKTILVVLPSQSEKAIPSDLMRVTRFWVDPDDLNTLETLLRTLTGQPEYAKPQLGQIPVMPPSVAASLGVSNQLQEVSATEFQEYSAVLKAVKDSTERDRKSDRMSMLVGLLDAMSS